MTLVGVPRVVPSGKVYRQIFDDEINLVRTLGEARSKIAQHKLPQIPGTIPLVRDVETCSGNGFLSHRQQMWVEGMPNDDITENPVQYKEAATLAFLKTQESENVIAAREVRGLAEVIIPEKKNSDIVERITESRRCRHEEMVMTLRQELACIGKEMEVCFLEPGKLFLTKLSESDHTIESLFQASAENLHLENYTMEDFEAMWNLVSKETLKRRQWIRELDKALLKAEVDRTERIKLLLNKYNKILDDISYFLPSDVHRIIHKEAMMINQALLANRRAIAKLFVNLMEADLKGDIFYHRKLEERIKTWRAKWKQNIIYSFRQFMESERIRHPTAVNVELESMLKDQESLTEKRTALLYSLGNMLPLMQSKAELNEWYESVVALNKQIDTHNVQYLMKIRLQYEKVCQECLSKVQECKNKLIDKKICTENEAERIVNPNFYQLVGKLQSRFEQEVEKMDDHLEQLVKHTEINCRNIYQYFQDALTLFDNHKCSLVRHENELHSKMNECRNKHENLNKLREVNLDVAVDKLRTQSSDEKLKAQLEKVYNVLDFIRAGYTTFQQDLLTKLSTYPECILRSLNSYSTSVSRYFNVREVYKGKPFKRTGDMSEEEEEMGEDVEESEGMEEGFSENKEEQEEEEEQQVEVNPEAEESQTAVVGDSESSAPESDGATIPRDRGSFVLESDNVEKSDERSSSTIQEAVEVRDVEDATAPASVRFSRSPSRQIEMNAEFFTTSSGNTYKVALNLPKLKIKKSEKYYVGKLKANLLPSYLEQVYLSESFFTDVRRQIRLQFFEHLENWYAETLSKAWVIVDSKKEEISSEVQLRAHLHEPRRERIEKDIYDVRMAELRFHNDRLLRHCSGVVEALNKEKAAFSRLREDQNRVSKTFRQKIQDMENIFLTETRADKLLALSSNMRTELIDHVEVMQLSLRSYRQYLEEALGKLRETNTAFLKACRLFADGGNFSPEELDGFIKRLHKESGRIEFVEGLIMIDLEKMESSYLEQATEVINRYENKFRYLALDRLFIEKIQRFLTNTQVKIKTEVAKSNWQTQTLNSYMEKLTRRIDACTHPTADKEDPVFSYVQDPTIPTSMTTSIQSDSMLQESKTFVMGVECTSLLNPSRMGKPAFDDAAISVIKHLIGSHRSRRLTDANQEKERLQSAATGTGTELMPKPFSPAFSGGVSHRESTHVQTNLSLTSARKSSSFGKRVSGSVSSIQRYTKTTRVERKMQIFGDKPQDNDSEHLKGIIFGILWDNFDIIMNSAEEFYKKDKHQITQPEYLQETYELCVDVLGQKLLMYLLQVDEYRVACISEFRDQLKSFEEQLPHIVRLVIGKLHQDHEQLFKDSMEQIRHNLQEQMQKWDIAKEKNKHKLRPTLGHPDNLPVLEALCQEEEERQKEQAKGIHLSTKQQEDCVINCAQRFVSSLAATTEKMLVEMDGSLTVDDVEQGKVEVSREKTCTLIRRKKAGLSLETEAYKLVAERGSRTWPGIPRTTLACLPNQIICRETTSLTTSKTTLGHMAAMEKRDAVYVRFKELLEVEFARIKKEKTSLLMKAQHWTDWWKKSVQKIKQLYA
ncbi:coiled-coil domain-containing protein 180 isoform X2 [Zootoca vivipara]|uniref:coiled-coil domain-containing protein 180 isoform X2 n=1 Tax=Zootoca vivipara TaxID=8524 RepID=UPI00293C09A9|nr:coiled-coil domain-containing protein 180 isoform X2 [Zootoca vivipara]